jgi:hypothetical protein
VDRFALDIFWRLSGMLVNMMGIEEGDEIVDIHGRSSLVVVDPKTRDTLTTIVSAVLTSILETSAPNLSTLAEPTLASVFQVSLKVQRQGNSELRESAA